MDQMTAKPLLDRMTKAMVLEYVSNLQFPKDIDEMNEILNILVQKISYEDKS